MRQLLINTLSIQSYSGDTKRMEAYILDFIESMGLTAIYDDGNIYVTKGEAETYPCIVSHTDSVHKIIDDGAFTIIANDEYAIGFDRFKMLPSGCGGDDKVGIAICLQALIDFDNIKVAFFRDEEVGCIGSGFADLKWFQDCRFVLQCDRRGNSDFINEIYGTQLQSKQFKKDVRYILTKYGYTPTSGMLTDVYTLKESGLEVSVANISCGYYNPHDDNEIVVFEDVYNCYALVSDIILSMDKTYKHKSRQRGKYNDWYGGYDYGYKSYGGYKSGYNYSHNTKAKFQDPFTCQCCCDIVEGAEVTYNREYGEYICKTCNEWLEAETKQVEKIF